MKKGNPLTYQELADTFETLEKEAQKEKEDKRYRSPNQEMLMTYERCDRKEKNRGRMEHRTMHICKIRVLSLWLQIYRVLKQSDG